MEPTPTANALPLCKAEFATLAEALDHAARGCTGYNFYNGAGKLWARLPYAKLRQEAQLLARRLLSLKPERGARVAMVADTGPDFMRFFFACQYAGLVPVPLPAAIYIGGHKAYVENLERLLFTCRAAIAMAPDTYLPLLQEAAQNLKLSFCGCPRDFDALPPGRVRRQSSRPHEPAYLQYTSGSTRFPRGVLITQAAAMNNLKGIVRHGLQVNPCDRAMSWLPYYHDMGLVGFVLAPMASQVSVDYLNPRHFAMRPKLWPVLISKNRATLSFSPPFGYELCMKSLKPGDIHKLDLSSWRVAGLGAEPIRAEPLVRFSDLLAPAGFDARAFVAGYGMAECTLAISFSPLGKGLILDSVDRDRLAESQKAVPPRRPAQSPKLFVDCGEPLPGYEIEIRNTEGQVVSERSVGTLYVRGPSVMTGYLGDADATRNVLATDGWLNTGDLAYRVGRRLMITGREKDMIIINGRNVWPQDLECLAESQPEVRVGDASAFAAKDAEGREQAVLVIQCRNVAAARNADLADRVRAIVFREQGIPCTIELVARHTLPRTTSGKLSRSSAHKDYTDRQARVVDAVAAGLASAESAPPRRYAAQR
ncbi:MAG: fatty acyl-AMP ligase [Desulfosarcina sp.]|nr:fatty acyl-AMP ligase [Desulfobacterales bacterium]